MKSEPLWLFEIYLKAKSLRRVHTRNKKDKFRQVFLFFFLSLISFTLSARDFLCAVFGFGTSLYSDPPEKLFPAVSSACGRPPSIFVTLNRCTQEKTSGTQSSLASLLKVMLHGTIGNDVFSTTKCWNVGTIL